VSTRLEDGCTDCADDTDHCHWAWIAHPDGGECLALECHFGPESHVTVIACTEVDHGCCA